MSDPNTVQGAQAVAAPPADEQPLVSITAKTPLWANLFAVAKSLDESVELKCELEGVQIRAMDLSKLVLVDMWCDKSVFSDYRLDAANRFRLQSEHVDKVLKRMKAAKKNDDITLAVYADGFLAIRNANTEYKIKTQNPTSASLPVPKVELPAEIVMPWDLLLELIKDAAIVGDHVGFTVNAKSMVVTSKGDMGTFRKEIKEEDLQKDGFPGGLTVKEGVSGNKTDYMISLFQSVLSNVDGAAQVVVSLGQSRPLKLKTDVSGIAVALYVAPRDDNG